MRITEDQIAAYRRDGFVKIPNLFSREEAFAFREVALSVASRLDTLGESRIFDQYVNVWTADEGMCRLTRDPRIAAAARVLAGVPLRLWHDQILIKSPRTSLSTEYHQDQPYWPHSNAYQPISCWIALGDVPVEAGCMTFIPGQQGRTDLAPQNLADEASLMDMAPEMKWLPRITVPLQAGDVTFHHGRCPHMATPNLSSEPRVAHVVIFTDADTTYNGAGHVVTDGLGLERGRVLDHDLFPIV